VRVGGVECINIDTLAFGLISEGNALAAADLLIASDSPVAPYSSHLTLWPEIKIPSRGTISPGSRRATSPTSSSLTWMTLSTPQRTTHSPFLSLRMRNRLSFCQPSRKRTITFENVSEILSNNRKAHTAMKIATMMATTPIQLMRVVLEETKS